MTFTHYLAAVMAAIAVYCVAAALVTGPDVAGLLWLALGCAIAAPVMVIAEKLTA